MSPSLHYRAFLATWALTLALDAMLDGYAPDLPSLTPRAMALGTLLWLATLEHRSRMAPAIEPAGALCRAVYVALYAGLGGPLVAWHYLAPSDPTVLASLRHAAVILLAFTALTVLMIRNWQGAADRRASRRFAGP